MSKGQYDTVKYVGQELHLALRRLFSERQYGEITIRHRDNELNSESFISYSVSGLEVRMHLSKNDKGYHLNAQVGPKGSENLETKSDRDLKLKRSPERRISAKCMDDLALESLRYLREYSKSKEVKQ